MFSDNSDSGSDSDASSTTSGAMSNGAMSNMLSTLSSMSSMSGDDDTDYDSDSDGSFGTIGPQKPILNILVNDPRRGRGTIPVFAEYVHETHLILNHSHHYQRSVASRNYIDLLIRMVGGNVDQLRTMDQVAHLYLILKAYMINKALLVDTNNIPNAPFRALLYWHAIDLVGPHIVNNANARNAIEGRGQQGLTINEYRDEFFEAQHIDITSPLITDAMNAIDFPDLDDTLADNDYAHAYALVGQNIPQPQRQATAMLLWRYYVLSHTPWVQAIVLALNLLSQDFPDHPRMFNFQDEVAAKTYIEQLISVDPQIAQHLRDILNGVLVVMRNMNDMIHPDLRDL